MLTKTRFALGRPGAATHRAGQLIERGEVLPRKGLARQAKLFLIVLLRCFAQLVSRHVPVFLLWLHGSVMDVSDLRVKTANGKINLDRINGNRAEVETANGKIKIISSRFDNLEAETINGGINLEGDFIKVETQSFNGNISYKLTGNRTELIQAKATTAGLTSSSLKGYQSMGSLRPIWAVLMFSLSGCRFWRRKVK